MSVSSHSIERRVELHQTDLGGLMHHPNYFIWMEETEYDLFERIDEPVIGPIGPDLRGSGWPRSKVSMSFLRPLHYRDRVRITLEIRRIRAAGIEYEARFDRLESDGSLTLVAKGAYTAMYCLYDIRQRSEPQPLPIPESFVAKVAAVAKV